MRTLIVGPQALIVGALCLFGAFLLTPRLAGEQEAGPHFRGKLVSFWRQAILDSDPDISSSFGINLGGQPDPAGIPLLFKLLRDKKESVCFFACNAVNAHGPAAKNAIPALLDMLKHPNLFHRRNGSLALAAVVSKEQGKEAIPGLLKGLRENDLMVNYHCAKALGHLGKQAETAIPALLEFSKSDRAGQAYLEGLPWTVGDAAVWALDQIGHREVRK